MIRHACCPKNDATTPENPGSAAPPAAPVSKEASPAPRTTPTTTTDAGSAAVDNERVK